MMAKQPTFTPNQYNRILQMIDKEDVVMNMANTIGISISVHAISMDCMENRSNAHGEEQIWIVDSGATCHMTSRLTI